MSNDGQKKGTRPAGELASDRTTLQSRDSGYRKTTALSVAHPSSSSVSSVNPGPNRPIASQPQTPSNPVARKSAAQGPGRRPELPSIGQGNATASGSGVTALKTAQLTPAKRANISAKSLGRATKTVGLATKGIGSPSQPTPPLGRGSTLGRSTPSRVHFQVQRKSPTPSKTQQLVSSLSRSAKVAGRSSLGQPQRISSGQTPTSAPHPNFRRHTMGATVTPQSSSRTPDTFPTKSYKLLSPLWKQLDDEYEDRMRIHKRDREGNMVGLVKRISSAGRRAPANQADVVVLDASDPNHVPAEIGPKLKLIIAGETIGSDEDEGRYRPQARLINRKVAGPQIAAKSARKLHSVDTSSSESDDDSMNSSSDKSTSEIDQLDSDQYDVPTPKEDVEMRDVDQPPELFLLDRTPTILAPLPDLRRPSNELIAAVEALSLTVIRMKKTRQLPFLLRNIRQGFLVRCRDLLLPIYPTGRAIVLHVQYDYAGGSPYHAVIPNWQCPLCDLLGPINTREMLDCHLQWDHPEVHCTWKILEDESKDRWKLDLVIPEVQELEPRPLSEVSDKRHASIDEPHKREGTVPRTPVTRAISSPFPSVSLSPPSARHPTRDPTPHVPKIEGGFVRKMEPPLTESSSTSDQRSTTVASTSRSRSTNATAATGSTSATARRRPRSPDSRYPIPPPPENPLGPSAQPPYLPAESDYGGPTVYYSCRPGGPCLFDLLGTLPMEPFGVLDWEILDREDEIYESDDVREEYKVMHALWARWIFLNRNKFIANYGKGAISFIDDYWKIIHRAAGWDALRYFLLILLANQFLNARELAQVLLHYEKHTGMASWYD